MLIETDINTFKTVVKERSVNHYAGSMTHEHLYLDIEGRIIASMLTSSWGAETKYKVDEKFGYLNRETINLIGGIIKNKE